MTNWSLHDNDVFFQLLALCADWIPAW